MEDECIVEEKGFIKILILMIAAIYIFNLDYPQKIKRTMEVFQIMVLKMGNQNKKDNVIRNFFEKLND